MKVRQIKELVREYNLGISPRRLGQHFLVDARALSRIAQGLEVQPGDRVLEIGAGLGALTEELLGGGATLYAVERDPRFLKVLSGRFRDRANLQLVHADILKLDLGSYAMGEEGSLRIAGNIPYSLTSPILEFLLHQRRWVRRVVLTIQKEVADRIVAKPATKAYSSLTVLVAVAFQPSVVFSISPGAFYPRPEVTSSVLRLDPLASPLVPAEEQDQFLRWVRGVFLHRRKTLLNAIRTSGQDPGQGRDALERTLERIGLDPGCRAETLGLEPLLSLYRATLVEV